LRKVIVIPKAERDSANTFCNSIGAEGETFTVKLYKSGKHTHYICNWLVSESQASEIDEYFTNVYSDTDEALTALNLKFAQPDIDTFDLP
jgi:hypothetical protein